ncbi:hypothetical protein GCM10027415_16120 [Humibacter ginsengisoli]
MNTVRAVPVRSTPLQIEIEAYDAPGDVVESFPMAARVGADELERLDARPRQPRHGHYQRQLVTGSLSLHCRYAIEAGAGVSAHHEHGTDHGRGAREHGGRAAVITVSDRAAVGTRVDESGPLAAALLADAGWHAEVRVVPDELDAIAGSIRSAIAGGAQLVVTTGGTGLAPRDVTPEATTPLLDRALPGIAEELRRVGSAALPNALLSRGVAGVRENALVVNLAGSPGAVRDGIPVVLSVAAHVVQQLSGGEHASTGPTDGDHS